MIYALIALLYIAGIPHAAAIYVALKTKEKAWLALHCYGLITELKLGFNWSDMLHPHYVVLCGC